MKLKNRERLTNHDLHKYCEQIGISEIPRVITNRKEANTFRKSIGCARNENRKTLGRCYREENTIYVAEQIPGGLCWRKFPTRRKGWVRWERRRWNYREQLHTLVHELVHLRWKNMPHGRKFEQRIREILRGQQFEVEAEPS